MATAPHFFLSRAFYLLVVLLTGQALCDSQTPIDIWFELGAWQYQQDDFAEALHAFRQALEFAPDDYAIHHNIGLCLMKLDNSVEAISHFESAIQLRPDHAVSYLNQSQLLKKLGKGQEAIAVLQRGLAIIPFDVQLNEALGLLCKEQRQCEKAIECFRVVVKQDQHNLIALDGLASVLCMAERYDEAFELYKSIFERDSSLTAALYMMGVVLTNLSRVDEAIEILKKVIAVTDGHEKLHEQAHIALGTTYLTRGSSDSDWIDGWREYEWRWVAYTIPKKQYNDKPFWDGSDLHGKTILVIAEQGFGDTFQFIRYAKLLKHCGARIVFMCQPALKNIVQIAYDDIDELVCEGDLLPEFDCQIHLLSLPGIFKTIEKTIPADIPYIKSDPALVLFWREMLASDKNFKIGLCWQGSQSYLCEVIPNKSIPLNQLLAPLAKIPGCSFYSLQKMGGAEQLKGLHGLPIHDFGDDFDGAHGRFMDTAALIMNLDLVISVDTAVAHLAAGLGVPTWILLPTPSDWRWMVTRLNTPWYPHARLFRQPSTGDWSGLLATVATEMDKVVHAVGSEQIG